MDDIYEKMKQFFEGNFEPSPNSQIIIALHRRLGHHSSGYYYTTDIKKYLKISKNTYDTLVVKEFGLLDKVHFRMASDIIIKVESALSLQDRLYEELLYVLENPR
jgi:hypothetical protein